MRKEELLVVGQELKRQTRNSISRVWEQLRKYETLEKTDNNSYKTYVLKQAKQELEQAQNKYFDGYIYNTVKMKKEEIQVCLKHLAKASEGVRQVENTLTVTFS